MKHVPTGGAVVGTAAGRADLLRAYVDDDPAALASMARILGFGIDEEKLGKGQEAEGLGKGLGNNAEGVKRRDSGTTTTPTAFEPVPFWRPTTYERTATEGGSSGEVGNPSEILQRPDFRRSGEPPPPTPPIAPPARLRRALDEALRTPRPRREVDVDALVKAWSRGEVLHDVPRRSGLVQARIALILDGSRRLVPLWGDLLGLAAELVEERGLRGVRLIPPPGRRRHPLPRVDTDEIVLAATDLGLYGDARDRRPWRRLGLRLRRRGERFLALVPCPARLWQPKLTGLWSAIDWSAPMGAPRRRGSEAEVDLLLTAISPALRAEPGLIREIRQLLGAHVDLAAEIELWRHPSVDGGSTESLGLGEDAPKWRRRFAELSDDLKEDIAIAILRWHRRMPRDVRAAEGVLHLLAAGVPRSVIGEDALDDAETFFRQLKLTLGEAGPGTRLGDALQHWFGATALGGALNVQNLDSNLLELVTECFRIVKTRDPELALPVWASSDLVGVGAPQQPERRHVVWQMGEVLRVRSPGATGAGSPVAEIRARGSLGISDGDRARPEIDLQEEDPEQPWPEGEGPILLASDVEEVWLDPSRRPGWSSSAGRDRYGLWATFEFKGVVQRMRWLPPGRFWMGSPESEQGRWDNEGPRHEVELTEGFWLAETPCTQELWQAVMGANPSEFQSPLRPVENLSWEDCHKFFGKLNAEKSGLDLGFPTEAQWEYACRAGTATATWRGELEILGERNAPLLDSIAWYGGNSGVGFDLEEVRDTSTWAEKQYADTIAGPREVGSKTPNPWGLHDMLGNVYEWCGDYWADSYGEGLAVDPEGPGEGSARVIRGGSWGSLARRVRAASRRWSPPGLRRSYLGFRLARGQGRGAQEGEPSDAVSARERRGTSRRRRRPVPKAADRPGWAVVGGHDEFGRWASIAVDDVVQRFRWLPPGRFWMGSPEGEQGRWDDEGPRHEVELTHGLWLADTPCTQELWQAVMGENPSRFQSPRRPVEMVSWEDCVEFLLRLNDKISGLDAGFPTEAEWEYACRAGTEEATWLGDLEILGANHSPLLDDIAWYRGNSGVGFDLEKGADSSEWREKQFDHRIAGTRQVGTKKPNPWGLHDMLGNVFEWCWDWNGSYGEELETDPRGPEQGSGRVFRGGSWFSYARYVRAAYRLRSPPGNRFSYLGLRLARGQGRGAWLGGAVESGRRAGGSAARDEPVTPADGPDDARRGDRS